MADFASVVGQGVAGFVVVALAGWAAEMWSARLKARFDHVVGRMAFVLFLVAVGRLMTMALVR